MTPRYCYLLLLLLSWYGLSAQVTFRIIGLPDDTPLGDRIFLAGNFNNWNPGDSVLSIEWKDPGQRTFRIDPAPGRLEFKFTRGSWAQSEGNAQGGFLPNRQLNYSGQPLEVEIQIAGWENSSNTPRGSTASPNVYVLDDNFHIPQLDRYRRILIFLPYSYFGSDQKYPVLYMQDAQNLFDTATSFSGEWGVDETLNGLFSQGFPEVMVVAVDNGGEHRIGEYTASPHPQYGGGEGAAYLEFMVKTLKPYVDRHFRTLSDPGNTGIMGSSLGGLISLYALTTYPEVFGMAGIFSPSLWWSEAVYRSAAGLPDGVRDRVYLLGSYQESKTLVPEMIALANTLKNAGLPEENIYFKTTTDGAHSEWYWARELAESLNWLLREQDRPGQKTGDLYWVSLTKNTRQTTVKIKSDLPLENLQVKLFQANGNQVSTGLSVRNTKVRIPSLPPGIYYLGVYQDDRLLSYLKMER